MIQFGVNFSTLGVPETGLTPAITIRDTADGSMIIDAVAMPEVGGGAYKYDFSNDTAKQYSVVIDGGVDTLDSRYQAAWSERAIAEDSVDELQANQGNWLTATGFSIPNEYDAKINDIHDTALGGLNVDHVANTLTLYKVNGSVLKIYDLPSTADTVPAYIGRTPQ